MRKNPYYHRKVHAVCSYCGEDFVLTLEERRGLHIFMDYFCSRDCLLSAIKAANFPSFGDVKLYLPVLPGQERLEYCPELEIAFASKYELYVALWLFEQGEQFWYERFSFAIGERHFYTPDFFLPKRNLLLEVKGQWGPGQASKMTEFRKQYPELPIYLISWTLHKEFYPNGGNGNG